MNWKPMLICLLCSAGLAVSAGETKMPFLGVATRSLTAAEQEQLNLPRGVGLRVEKVVPGSAAASEMIYGDVLHRLDDQVLVNPEQLAVLVGLRKPGDGIELQAIRDGRPIHITMELGERPLIEMAQPVSPRRHGVPSAGFGRAGMDSLHEMEARMRERMERLGGVNGPMAMHPMIPGGAGHDSSVSIQMKSVNGETHLRIVEDGNEVFNGPVTTPEQQAEIPMRFRDQLDLPETDGGNDRGTML